MLPSPCAQRCSLLPAFLRHFSSRPGQPPSLHSYDRGPLARPPPRAVVEAEAERMGRTWSAGVERSAAQVRLAVPRSPHEFAHQRSAFRRGLGAVRKEYALAWRERRAAEASAAAEAAAGVAALKSERDAVRAVQRRVALAAQGLRVQGQQAARAARRAVAASRASQGQAQLAELRSAWLAELEADARTWITPERIDELITPALFSQKFGWQWEDWFSSKELKRQLREDARRTRRAGVPLTEVQLPPTLQPYAEDWESGGEEEAEGAEAAAALAPASREAARHASPAIALALAAAREAARARGMALAEPGYDFDGAALPEGDSAEDVAALRARASAREGGVSLAELAQGRSLQDILSDYEGWLEAQARELEASLEREREREMARAGGAEGEGEAEQVRSWGTSLVCSPPRHTFFLSPHTPSTHTHALTVRTPHAP